MMYKPVPNFGRQMVLTFSVNLNSLFVCKSATLLNWRFPPTKVGCMVILAIRRSWCRLSSCSLLISHSPHRATMIDGSYFLPSLEKSITYLCLFWAIIYLVKRHNLDIVKGLFIRIPKGIFCTFLGFFSALLCSNKIKENCLDFLAAT